MSLFRLTATRRIPARGECDLEKGMTFDIPVRGTTSICPWMKAKIFIARQCKLLYDIDVEISCLSSSNFSCEKIS